MHTKYIVLSSRSASWQRVANAKAFRARRVQYIGLSEEKRGQYIGLERGLSTTTTAVLKRG